jgi:hypothetical protein
MMLEVLEHGRPVTVFYVDALSHHGGNSPGGVAIAFRALERALALLGPSERSDLVVETPFGGPGARDAIEYVTGNPPTIEPELARRDLPRTREKFVFRVRSRDRSVTLTLRDGFVTDETLDDDLAERVKAAPGEQLFEAHQQN